MTATVQAAKATMMCQKCQYDNITVVNNDQTTDKLDAAEMNDKHNKDPQSTEVDDAYVFDSPTQLQTKHCRTKMKRQAQATHAPIRPQEAFE